MQGPGVRLSTRPYNLAGPTACGDSRKTRREPTPAGGARCQGASLVGLRRRPGHWLPGRHLLLGWPCVALHACMLMRCMLLALQLSSTAVGAGERFGRLLRALPRMQFAESDWSRSTGHPANCKNTLGAVRTSRKRAFRHKFRRRASVLERSAERPWIHRRHIECAARCDGSRFRAEQLHMEPRTRKIFSA